MKRLFAFMIAICMGALLTGCAFFNSNEESSPSPTATSTQQSSASSSASQSMSPLASPTASPIQSATPTPTASVSSEPVTYEDNKISFEYYDVAQDRIVDATVEVEGKGDVQSAIDAVNDVYIKKVLGDSGIQTNSIVYSGGNIYVDFTDSIYNLNMGSSGESGVLESIADAYLNNVQGIKAVYYSVNGYDYSSGHLEFSKDEPYKTK